MKRQLTIKEIKEISASILFAFDKICRENNITYSVCYGTLLGTIRHSGFIPWDDDIDILLTRDNYNKLTALLSKRDLFCGQYKLLDLNSEKKYSAPLAKLIDMKTELVQYNHAEKVRLGVYIDVFVFDKVPEDEILRKKLFRKLDKIQKVWTASEMKPVKGEKNVLKILIKKFLNQGMARVLALQMNRIAIQSNKTNSKSRLYSNLLYCTYGREKETFDYKSITSVKQYEFENHHIMGFVNYELFLRRLYNDYTELPPEEKRHPHHDFIAYWK